MDAQKILDNLDEHCGQWPILNPIETHFRVGDARMTVFRSETEWAIFFEVVEYVVGQDEFQISLYAFGNCFQEMFSDGLDLNQSLSRFYRPRFYRHPFALPQAIAPDDAQEQTWPGYNRHHFSLWLRGKRLDFAPTAEEYTAAGIVFDEARAASEKLEPEQLLRFLCHHLNHPFFSSEDYLRFVLDTFRLPPAEGLYHQVDFSHYMALFLQAGAWQDADGYLTEWNTQDPATFNTDWRPWEAERRDEASHRKAFAEQQAAIFSNLPAEIQLELQEMQQRIIESGTVGNFPISWHLEMTSGENDQHL